MYTNLIPSSRCIISHGVIIREGREGVVTRCGTSLGEGNELLELSRVPSDHSRAEN